MYADHLENKEPLKTCCGCHSVGSGTVLLTSLHGSVVFGSVQSELLVMTASVEQSFSKLKLIKTQLTSRCGEGRLSEPLLTSIEREGREAINIYKVMAKRILLLFHQFCLSFP